MPNIWYERICQNFAFKISPDGRVEEGGAFNVELVQDRCPVACRNLDCTCADKRLKFFTTPSFNSDTGVAIDGVKERSCKSVHYERDYRSLVCLLEVHAVTEKPTYVYSLCPKACGLKPECFCRDSKGPVSTPDRGIKERTCKEASIYPESGRQFFCNELENPEFSRSCPIICEDEYCLNFLRNADSTNSLSIYASRLSTTCSIITASDSLYQEYACSLKEDDLQVPITTLCPNACASFLP